MIGRSDTGHLGNPIQAVSADRGAERSNLSMEPMLITLLVILTVIVASVLFWLFPLKLVVRLRRESGKNTPCPFRFAWVLDLRFRRWVYRFVLDRLGLQPGMIVLEVGAGTGNLSVPVAGRVGPKGEVIAVDLQPEMIIKLEKKARDAGVTNLKTCVANACELPLQDASVDCVIFVTVLGELTEPGPALHEAHRVLKDGGVLSITEDFTDPDYYGPGETAHLMERAGFAVEERFGSRWLYMLIGRKIEPVPA